MRTRFAIGLALLGSVLLMLPGCGDAPSTPADHGRVHGRITDAATADPMAGLPLVLLDVDRLARHPDGAVTDEEGRYFFQRVATGDHLVQVVFPDTLWAVPYSPSGAFVRVAAGGDAAHDISVVQLGRLGAGRYRIEGTVRDRGTGRPLAGAFVADVGWSFDDLYVLSIGFMPPGLAVTDDDGRFSIRGQTVGFLDDRLGLLPVSATCAGYRPRLVVGSSGGWVVGVRVLPLPPEGGSVLSLDIALEAELEGADPRDGAIRGRALWLGYPVPGVEVRLSLQRSDEQDTLSALCATPSGWAPSERMPAGATSLGATTPLPGSAVVTDREGRFVIHDVPPGAYEILAAWRSDDGWTHSHDYYGIVKAGQTDDVEDIALQATLHPLQPGETVGEGTPIRFVWSAVPPIAESDADLVYRVTAWSAPVMEGWQVSSPFLRESSWLLAAEPIPPETMVLWSVEAYLLPDTLRGQAVGVFERAAVFRVVR